MEAVARQKYQIVANRRALQWALMPIMVVTIALGWKFHLLGFSVAGAMAVGITGAFFKGRYVCGNLCPRGAFFDRLIAPLSRHGMIPSFMRGMPFRLAIVAALMGFMGWRISLDPTNPHHWGFVFWTMCAVTTAFGVVMAFSIHPRAWCTICPMGTIQNLIGGHKHQLKINSACRECRKCEKACPMSLEIVQDKESGNLKDQDCLKCPECIGACSLDALSWPNQNP